MLTDVLLLLLVLKIYEIPLRVHRRFLRWRKRRRLRAAERAAAHPAPVTVPTPRLDPHPERPTFITSEVHQ